MNKLAKEWIHKAENDFLDAENNLKSQKIPTDTVCFHCQQVAEKYMKAYLISKNKSFPKIHNLIRLMELCRGIDSVFSKLKNELIILNDYAVEIRYPDDWYEPTVEEANEALELAKKIKDFISTKIE
ncbi:MAG: HEPN domain-containing protein [Candidatus Cloacimonetes bacterium]|nr:HEPN domain-containing protein [Candidatus Cloacimonadota bacterium]